MVLDSNRNWVRYGGDNRERGTLDNEAERADRRGAGVDVG